MQAFPLGARAKLCWLERDESSRRARQEGEKGFSAYSLTPFKLSTIFATSRKKIISKVVPRSLKQAKQASSINIFRVHMQKEYHCGHHDLGMQAGRGLCKVTHFTLIFRPRGVGGNNQQSLGDARLFQSVYIALESQLHTVALRRGIFIKIFITSCFLET